MANDTLEGNRVKAIPRQQVFHTGLIDAIEGTLADFLAAQIASLDAIDSSLGGFARTARDLVLAGGKRLRPTFAYWGWRGLAGPAADPEPLLPALGALELMHTFALVHDDLMDDSATRRGRPTAHRIFAAQHGARFGSSAAVLVGDLCLVWADQLLARTPVPPATLLEVRTRYDRMRIEAVAGQYLDVLGETDPASWSVERALLVARHKTASYTVQWPLDFGLALAGVHDAEVAAAYRAYGKAVGEAFQLRDDLLGVYGDPAVTGKPAGDDLRAGKPTTLLMLARRMATPAQLLELDGAEVGRKAQVVAETGAPARVEEMIRARVTEGLTALASAPIDPEARGVLIELATVATQRPA
ncbi:polyprenyl synthetase family protein [Actinoplanes regularis]|uniref:polyprenyl synthetase family protein n=1 Tax=Actinoplanes regularis TaxID=52697 RepID=UPI0024A19E57|nr:polyprenyl synthetase family protein [Actinoplanes regularis]GLW34090.1 geranylgeranyl pyrophosphate synthase [Actinoplanes regularis]